MLFGWGIPDLHRPAYVTLMVTDLLEPNRHQAISNHYADLLMIKWYHSGTDMIYRIMYVLPWIPIFSHGWGDSAKISGVTTLWMKIIASRVTKNIGINGNPYVIFISYTFLCPDRAHKPAKTIVDCSFHHFRQGQSFLTWHCDVTTVKSVTSREREVLALWRHIHRLFLHVQIGAKVIFTSE